MKKPVIGVGVAALAIAGGTAIGVVASTGGAGADPAVSLCGLGLNAQAGGSTPGGVSLGTIPFTPGFDSTAGSQNLNLFGPGDCGTTTTTTTAPPPPTTTTTAPPSTTTTTAPPATTTTTAPPAVTPTTVTTSPSSVPPTSTTGAATSSSASNPPVGAGGASPTPVPNISAEVQQVQGATPGTTNGNG
jgi:hypothetical protein